MCRHRGVCFLLPYEIRCIVFLRVIGYATSSYIESYQVQNPSGNRKDLKWEKLSPYLHIAFRFPRAPTILLKPGLFYLSGSNFLSTYPHLWKLHNHFLYPLLEILPFILPFSFSLWSLINVVRQIRRLSKFSGKHLFFQFSLPHT